MSKKYIEVGGVQVEVIRKANLKNLYIRILPPVGEVTVTAPITISDEDITLFILKKLPEITKVRDRMLAQTRQGKREYVSGELHYLWGETYRLEMIYGGTKFKIQKTPRKIVFYAPEGATTEAKENAFNKWYRVEIKKALETVVPYCEKRTGIYAEEVKVKNMRTRWGTCNIEKRRIWLNLQLVKKPPECLEYVTIHELVHLVEKNHTYKFYSLVEKFCPTWREAKKMLESMPLDFMEKGNADTNACNIKE